MKSWLTARSVLRAIHSLRGQGNGNPLRALEHDAGADRDGADDLPAVKGLAQDHQREEDGEERLHVGEERRPGRSDAVDRGEPEDVREEERADDRVAEA